MPTSGNIQLQQFEPDPIAAQVAQEAGPDPRDIWFPQTGERIYQTPPCGLGDDPWW